MAKRAPLYSAEEIARIFQLVDEAGSVGDGLRAAAAELNRPYGAVKLKYYKERSERAAREGDPDLSGMPRENLRRLARALRAEVERRRRLLDEITEEFE